MSRSPKLLSAFIPILLAASCAPSASQKAAQSTASAGTATAVDGTTGPMPLPHAAHTFATRPPPATISTPRAGDPSGRALAEARLEPTTCEAATSAEIEQRVREMRAAVDASFQEWHDAQPGCWEEDRERYRMRKEMEAEQAGQPIPYPMMKRYAPSAMMDASGAGDGGGYGGGSYGLSAATKSASGPVAPSAAPPPRAAAVGSAEPKKATNASGTNNQVAGVDEADIVKTDGQYVYLASNGALRIVEAMNPHVVSVTNVPGIARDMFVAGDRAVVYTSQNGTPNTCTYGYDCQFGGDGTSTTVTVLDIANRAAPKVVRTMDLSGSLIAARRIGNAVHTVVSDGDTGRAAYEAWPEDFEMCGTMEDKVRAKFRKLKADNERKIRMQVSKLPTMRENGVAAPMCSGLLRTQMHDGNTFTTVVSFDLTDDKSKPQTASLESRPGAVFASQNALYVSVLHQNGGSGRFFTAYPHEGEVSEIHKFAIGESPRATKYVGSGMVPGHVLNQFAMDDWYGYLRIATTTGHVPDPNTASTVSVLASASDGNLVRVGAVEHLAPGEDIRAVRFDDDRAYVVTFKKTDPLFVLDMGEPAKPQVLGELKIPGFSTYMHRIDPEHLLSIGFDANDHGDFAYFDGVILQLFDVKNPTDPKLVHKEKIGSRGSSSQAATDHLAFNYVADRGLLAIPMTECAGGSDGVNGDTVTFSGLLVYDVDVERGFTKLGGVDHGNHTASCGTWWSQATSQVKRSVFLDDLVYSIAQDRVKVQRMGRFGKDLADIPM
jgi:hypothetical protein